MIRHCGLGLAILHLAAISCAGQSKSTGFPESLVIASRSFIDVGPPFDFYELIRVSPSAEGLSVERILITPEGQACLQPATVETRLTNLRETLPDFLQGTNPCAIPEKQLHKELKRCKKCLVFSGVDVTMRATCGGKDREIRMDILDRDMFDSRADTPEQTSWTMRILGEINKATGPGGWDRPVFATGYEAQKVPVTETETIRELREGKYDGLFGRQQLVSTVVREAEEPPPASPTVELVDGSSVAPLDPVMPKYPPIARAARIEGVVTVKFGVDSLGSVQNVTATDGKKLLEGAAIEAVARWKFPATAYGKSGEVKFQFKLNCSASVRTSVN